LFPSVVKEDLVVSRVLFPSVVKEDLVVSRVSSRLIFKDPFTPPLWARQLGNKWYQSESLRQRKDPTI
ncbi:hypothetical protein Taro_056803, partial [Colocasia esculenta]|nr:hypothetical protein [Colocasia esculenta]